MLPLIHPRRFLLAWCFVGFLATGLGLAITFMSIEALVFALRLVERATGGNTEGHVFAMMFRVAVVLGFMGFGCGVGCLQKWVARRFLGLSLPRWRLALSALLMPVGLGSGRLLRGFACAFSAR